MKRILLQFSAMIILLVLSSCASKDEKPDFLDYESNKVLIDGEKIKTQTLQRGDEIIKFAPDAIDIDSSTARKDTHKIIDREKPFDYATVEDSAQMKIFPIDMHVENVDIRTFTKMLSEITGINFLVSDEVNGFVTARLNAVPWTSALDSVLTLKHLAKYVDKKSNIIRIHSQEAIVQLEDFERKRKEDLQKTIQLELAAEPLTTEIFKVFYTKPDKVKEILTSVLGTSGESGGASIRNTNAQITIDDRMNTLIVKARRSDMNIVRKLIGEIDGRTRQVFIESFIVQINDDFGRSYGVKVGANIQEKFSAFKSREMNIQAIGFNTDSQGLTTDDDSTLLAGGSNLINLPAAAATSGIGLLFGISDTASLRTELTAMEKEGLSKTIANPRIFTLDNQEAIIFQGTEVPYETTSDSGTNIQFKEAGTRLAVTPTIVGDGNVILALQVNRDSVDETVTENPPITKSEIDTNLITKDGSIVVIGGLYTHSTSRGESKVPLLGDLPIAGALFRSRDNSKTKQELMVFISPRIL